MLWINVQSLTAHKWHRSFRWRWWADNSWNNKWISIVMFWHSCCAYCVSYFLFFFLLSLVTTSQLYFQPLFCFFLDNLHSISQLVPWEYMPSAVHVSLTRLTCLDNSQAFVHMFVPRFLSVSLLGLFSFFLPISGFVFLDFEFSLCLVCPMFGSCFFWEPS